MKEKANRLETKKEWVQKIQDGKAFQLEETKSFEAKRMGNRKRDGDEIWKRMVKECKK